MFEQTGHMSWGLNKLLWNKVQTSQDIGARTKSGQDMKFEQTSCDWEAWTMSYHAMSSWHKTWTKCYKVWTNVSWHNAWITVGLTAISYRAQTVHVMRLEQYKMT